MTKDRACANGDGLPSDKLAVALDNVILALDAIATSGALNMADAQHYLAEASAILAALITETRNA